VGDMKDLTQHILEAIQRDLAHVKHKVDKVDHQIDGLEDGLDALTEYVHVGFEAVIQQNDRRYLDHERRIRLLEARSPTSRKRRAFTPRRPR
jgi:hypothetical protein